MWILAFIDTCPCKTLNTVTIIIRIDGQAHSSCQNEAFNNIELLSHNRCCSKTGLIFIFLLWQQHFILSVISTKIMGKEDLIYILGNTLFIFILQTHSLCFFQANWFCLSQTFLSPEFWDTSIINFIEYYLSKKMQGLFYLFDTTLLLVKIQSSFLGNHFLYNILFLRFKKLINI